MQIACRGPEGGPQKGQQGEEEEGDGASKIPQNATRRPRLRGLNARIGRDAWASAPCSSLSLRDRASDGGGATDLGSHSRSQICSRVARRPGSWLAGSWLLGCKTRRDAALRPRSGAFRVCLRHTRDLYRVPSLSYPEPTCRVFYGPASPARLDDDTCIFARGADQRNGGRGMAEMAYGEAHSLLRSAH